MAKKQKFYVVWIGHSTGVFDSWEKCQAATKGAAGAKFKSYDSRAAAEAAFKDDYHAHIAATTGKGKRTSPPRPKVTPQDDLPDGPKWKSISVDAAASGNPGPMEYQGVETETGAQLFHQGPFENGTNNVGEFLALVHGLALLQRQQDDRPIYTDSKIAIGWVKLKKCKTKLLKESSNAHLFQLIERAETWLKNNDYANPILKWETKKWGEIPADFGRK